ncbi:MAG: hypothetical protein GXP14_01375 [Gammaproteobacteria bacterium]|nr:hypothetical protein [Gammaproteobacteria bacterium]
MNIKNKPLLTLVVKRKKTPLNVAHNPDKDDEHEDANWACLLRKEKSRKK